MARPIRPLRVNKFSVQMTPSQEKEFTSVLRDLVILIAKEELETLRAKETSKHLTEDEAQNRPTA